MASCHMDRVAYKVRDKGKFACQKDKGKNTIFTKSAQKNTWKFSTCRGKADVEGDGKSWPLICGAFIFSVIIGWWT